MRPREVGSTLLALAAVLVWLPAQADAQQERFYFEGRGGVATALSDLGALTDIGPSFGAQIGYWVHDRIALTLGGDVQLLKGRDADAQAPFPGSEATDDEGNERFPDEVFVDAPDFDVYHVVGGVELLVTERASPLEVRWGGGGGITSINTDQVPALSPAALAQLPPGAEVPADDFSETQVSIYTDLKVGYDVSPRFSIFAGTRPYVAFTDEDKTAFFSGIAEGSDPQGFGTAWTLPVHAGVKIGF